MLKVKLVSALALSAALCAPLANAQQLDPNEMALKYRHAAMTLVGQNFGPMAAMVKGEIPWNDEQFNGWAKDLAAVTSINMMRGFRPGSEVGKTRAKPQIWDNMDDFSGQMKEMPVLAGKLAAAAQSGDRGAIVEAFKAAGGNCKGCHDDYKSKDYLNQ
jgi:cytochrome c556